MNKYGKVLIVLALIAAVGIVFAYKNKELKNDPTSPTNIGSTTSQSADPATSTDSTAKDKGSSCSGSSCSCDSGAKPAADTTSTTDGDSTQKAAVPASLPRLLDLGADKCMACKMMTPILDELGEEYAGKLKVDFIDVWKDRSVGQKYGIKAIPTQILFDGDGKELFRHTGFFAKEDILAKWKELGYDFTK